MGDSIPYPLIDKRINALDKMSPDSVLPLSRKYTNVHRPFAKPHCTTIPSQKQPSTATTRPGVKNYREPVTRRALHFTTQPPSITPTIGDNGQAPNREPSSLQPSRCNSKEPLP